MARGSICLVFAALCLSSVSATLKIAAFNVQTMGVSKMGKPEVVNVLKQIISFYDMVLIQEIRDSSGEAIVELLEEVNSYSSEEYNMVISSRAGRSSYKEQYAFFYKKNKMTVLDSFEYPDNGDRFEREPYVVRFSAPSTRVGEFVVMALHAKPDDAVNELDLMADAYDYTVNQWGIRDVAIMGDLNADCSYVGSDDWQNIRLRTQSKFDWVIPDSADTTVSGNTNCAYDRFVLAGLNLRAMTSGAGVFYFDDFFGLDYTAAKAVSDHYPVELTID
ncbi:deoxyribonuclease-1-like [Lytechinus pictus]|uniref:deoxyribonuclease-1-like n=1 Tax=Lytechinus pictus TaxID=7653 RepID=UPI0030B9D127